MRVSKSYYFQLFDKALPGGSSARGRAQLSRVPVGPRRRALSVSSPILFESSSLQKIKNYRKVNVDQLNIHIIRRYEISILDEGLYFCISISLVFLSIVQIIFLCPFNAISYPEALF